MSWQNRHRQPGHSPTLAIRFYAAVQGVDVPVGGIGGGAVRAGGHPPAVAAVLADLVGEDAVARLNRGPSRSSPPSPPATTPHGHGRGEPRRALLTAG